MQAHFRYPAGAAFAGRTRGVDWEGATSCARTHNNFLDDEEIIGLKMAEEIREEIDLIIQTSAKFNMQNFLSGKQTPVFFGSAINNFGIQNLLNGFIAYAPKPKSRESKERIVNAEEKKTLSSIFDYSVPALPVKCEPPDLTFHKFKRTLRLHPPG